MAIYQAPGVYLRPRRTDQPDVRVVRTDVAGFVGFAERGPLPCESTKKVDDVALRITSWDEFRANFGGFIPQGYLAYAVRGFFENGGRTCYVARAAVTRDAPAKCASFSTWAFPGEPTNLMASLPAGASAGTPQRVRSAGTDLAGSELIIIRDPSSNVWEAHVLAVGNWLQLGGMLGMSYPSGSLVQGFRAAMILTATSAGSWGNRIRLDVTPLAPGSRITEFALRVTLEPGPDTSEVRGEELYRRLSLQKQDPAYAPNVLNGRSRLVRCVAPPEREGRDFNPASSVVMLDASFLAEGPFWLEGGRDGLSDVTSSDVTGGPDDFRGLRLLEEIDEVSILCVPDAVIERPDVLLPPAAPAPAPCAPPQEEQPHPREPDDPTAATPVPTWPAVYYAVRDQCERLRDRVAILDVPLTDTAKRQAVTTEQLLSWRDGFTSRFGAAYYPWLRVNDPLQAAGRYRSIPPSGHVAGVYARNDTLFGVYHPPANAAIEGVIDLVDDVTVARQEQLNPYGINVLRSFPGRGTRVWGARSLAGLADGDWRFIHARRLMSMIEESVEDSTQWAVFEPNDDRLRQTLVHSISVFLRAIWQRGGLKGNTPAEGFFVKCDETNNPPAVVDAGKVVCEVGVAVAAPMEFLVFEIRQKPEGAEVVEL